MDHQGVVDTGAASSSSFWSRSVSSSGADSGPHHGGRMAVEGHHRRLGAGGRGRGAQLGEEALMARVHAVVRTDGHRAAPTTARSSGRPDDLHRVEDTGVRRCPDAGRGRRRSA